MKFLFYEDELIAQFCRERLKTPVEVLKPGSFRSMGVMDDKYRLIAGIVFFNATPWNIEIGIAADSPRWCTKQVLRVVFRYCFEQLGVQRVTGSQAASNERAHKLVEGLGFTKEGEVRQGWFGQEDSWLYGMLKSDCKWL